jgi:hypothetical protein
LTTGRLSAAQAELWGLPNLAGRRYALMLPEGEGQSFLRFIDSKPTPGYAPFRHMGWNAAELMVQDTDGIAARLDGSPFKIIGPPADLSFSDKIRAMQALWTRAGVDLPDFVQGKNGGARRARKRVVTWTASSPVVVGGAFGRSASTISTSVTSTRPRRRSCPR